MSLLRRQWLWTTLLVIAAVGVMVRLGLWQLDRLGQRRANNDQILAQASAPLLNLNDELGEIDLLALTYRSVVVAGEYMYDQEVVLRNQVWNTEHGVHLLTPLRLAESEQVVIVDRGWIPITDYEPGSWPQYGLEGPVTVSGILRPTQDPDRFGFRPETNVDAGQDRLIWTYINLPALAVQLEDDLLPMYVQIVPGGEFPENLAIWPRELLPFPNPPELVLDEGPHLSYAIQWFIFAGILAIGYPFYVNRRPKEGAVV
jgi:surfeit locus 1 family protein